jgi:hypothetical protein
VSLRGLAGGLLAGSLTAALILSLWWPGPYVAVALGGAAVAVCWLAGLGIAAWRERGRGGPPDSL